ncbi:MAG TPA: flavin reductase family protein [Chroococcidiopsis sp.]
MTTGMSSPSILQQFRPRFRLEGWSLILNLTVYYDTEGTTLLDEQAKKTMLRKIPHGLYICGVTDGEEVNGFTASWVMQASFKPPLVVNCVNQSSISHGMIKASQVFALSFLEAGQKELAQKFFKPMRRVGNKFEDIEFYLGETGCPIISDTLGFVECRVVGAIEQGDHTVFVGEVIASGIHREGDPLLLETTGWQYGG